jgi:hypothetical protein
MESAGYRLHANNHESTTTPAGAMFLSAPMHRRRFLDVSVEFGSLGGDPVLVRGALPEAQQMGRNPHESCGLCRS